MLSSLIKSFNKRSPKNAYVYVAASPAQRELAEQIRSAFDVGYYLENNPDVESSRVDPVLHYVKHGEREGRQPTPDFDPAYYRARSSVQEKDNAFRHFVEFGGTGSFREEFETSDRLTYENGVVPARRLKATNDYALSVPLDYLPISSNNARIVAVIHIFYPDLTQELLAYLSRSPKKIDIIVSTDTERKAQQIRDAATHYVNGSVDIRLFENRGRDIGPFVKLLPTIIDDYDIVVHLHSKKSPHSGDETEQWREYLLDTLLGNAEIINSILHLLDSNRVGMVFSQHIYGIRPILNWGLDFDHCSSLARRMGVKLDKDMILEFPSGSMFWAKTRALSRLCELGLSLSDFALEAGQVDSTLAHGIERILPIFAEAAGFDWVKVTRSDRGYPYPRCVLRVKDEGDLRSAIAKSYRPILHTRSFGSTAGARIIPEIRPLNYYPSDNNRPRINLLINTINASSAFGGVATALWLLRELMHTLGGCSDYRIVVLDAAIEKTARSGFPEFQFEGLNSVDHGIGRVVVDASNRETGSLNLRANDIFITTAWWTAEIARCARNAQLTMFQSAHCYLYLIQDYEPNFYGWGTKWALAEGTYTNASDAIAIINSEELYSFFKGSRYKFRASYCLPYRINARLAKMLSPMFREKIILIYGRPSVQRNGFELLIDGLALWQRRNPTQAQMWRIVSLGEHYSLSLAEPLQNLSVLGKVTLEEYAIWLNQSSIGVSLMMSPHPSYPPLEMAIAGLMTITNRFAGKEHLGECGNLTVLSSVTADEISDAIEACVMRYLQGSYQNAQRTLVRPSISGEVAFDVSKIVPFFPVLQSYSQGSKDELVSD